MSVLLIEFHLHWDQCKRLSLTTYLAPPPACSSLPDCQPGNWSVLRSWCWPRSLSLTSRTWTRSFSPQWWSWSRWTWDSEMTMQWKDWWPLLTLLVQSDLSSSACSPSTSAPTLPAQSTTSFCVAVLLSITVYLLSTTRRVPVMISTNSTE